MRSAWRRCARSSRRSWRPSTRSTADRPGLAHDLARTPFLRELGELRAALRRGPRHPVARRELPALLRRAARPQRDLLPRRARGAAVAGPAALVPRVAQGARGRGRAGDHRDPLPHPARVPGRGHPVVRRRHDRAGRVRGPRPRAARRGTSSPTRRRSCATCDAPGGRCVSARRPRARRAGSRHLERVVAGRDVRPHAARRASDPPAPAPRR